MVVLETADKICRKRECNIGNLITDAFTYVAARVALCWNDTLWSLASIAVINSGAIKDTSKKVDVGDDITHEHIQEILPHNDELYIVTLTGGELIEMLEFSVHSEGETSFGEFLQIAGLKVIYNKKRDVGQRLIAVSVKTLDSIIPDYVPVVLEEKYNVVLPSFIGDGGDDYTVLKNANKRKLGLDMQGAVKIYMKKTGILYPGYEGRIQIKE